MSDTNYVDFYGINSLLTDKERKVRDAVRTLVDDECMPIIAEHFDKGTFPMDLIARMASMELFGGHVDGYGCRKRSHTEYGPESCHDHRYRDGDDQQAAKNYLAAEFFEQAS